MNDKLAFQKEIGTIGRLFLHNNYYKGTIMSSKLKMLIASIITSVIGFVVIQYGELAVSPQMSFVIGALITGFLVFILDNVNEDSDDETTSDESKTTLYVGNLPYRANEIAVKEHFAQYGSIESVRLMRDRKTGKRKGFGFVEVAASDADSIISELNDTEFQERTLKVRLAKERNKEE